MLTLTLNQPVVIPLSAFEPSHRDPGGCDGKEEQTALNQRHLPFREFRQRPFRSIYQKKKGQKDQTKKEILDFSGRLFLCVPYVFLVIVDCRFIHLE